MFYIIIFKQIKKVVIARRKNDEAIQRCYNSFLASLLILDYFMPRNDGKRSKTHVNIAKGLRATDLG